MFVEITIHLILSKLPINKELSSILCIEKDNSALKGSFFEDQGYPQASQVFSPGGKGTKHLGFHSYRGMRNIPCLAIYQRWWELH